MSDAVTIRAVAPADHEAWRRLWAAYNAFYGRSGPNALPDEIVRSTWNRILDPAEPVHGLVAESGGELVGLAHYLFHRNLLTIEDTCYLQDLFTDPAVRGRGVGRALIEGVGERAVAVGVRKLYWHTHETNHAAMRLYDALATHTGFVVYRKQL